MTKSYKKNNPSLRQPKMQHIRHVKPEYFVHEGVNNMSVAARYAEMGTWTCADKYGRFEWKPRTLKRLVMPDDAVDFESLMNEWITHGFAEKYEVGGQVYGRFFNWEKHQGINLREKNSAFEYPAPSTLSAKPMPTHADTCVHVQTCGMSEGEGKGLGVEEGERVAQPAYHQPETKTEGGSDGSLAPLGSTSKPFASLTAGKEKEELSGWRADFQAQVQMVAIEHGVVFAVNLPESVFSYIEDLAEDCDLLTAQRAVLEWLGCRSFTGLDNPNTVWSKMPDEMAGIADYAIEDYHRSQRRRIIAAVS